MKEQQHEPSKIGYLLGEVNQPTVMTYTLHGPSKIGSLPDEISQPAAKTYTPQSPTSHLFSPATSLLPAQPTAPARSSRLASVMEEQRRQPSNTGSLLDEVNQPAATAYTPHLLTSQPLAKQENKLSSELVVPPASIMPHNVLPTLLSTAGALNQHASLPVYQHSKLPASQVITPSSLLAASTNSNIPLFHPSMLPNRYQHASTSQSAAGSNSYGYINKNFTERSAPSYSSSTALHGSPTNPYWKPATHVFVPNIPLTVQSSLSNDMKDLKPAVAATIPQAMYRQIVNNEMEDLQTAFAVIIPQPMYRPTMKNELAELEPPLDLGPGYTIYRNTKEKKLQVLRWDIEDNRDPRSGYDCSNVEMKENHQQTSEWELRVPKCSNIALINEIRVPECPDTALDNDIRVSECSTIALDNESRVAECPTTALDNRVANCPTTTLNNEIVQSQLCPNEEKTMSDLHAALKKEHLRVEELGKELKEEKAKRVRIWRSTVEEAVTKRNKRLEIVTAERLAELDHKESSLRDERKQFETNCDEREEDLKSREQKVGSNERDYARRLRDLQTREAQVAEFGKRLKLWEEEKQESEKVTALKLEEADEELKKLRKEKDLARDTSDTGQIPPVDVFKGSPDISCNDSADLSTVSSSSSSKTPSMFINDREIELEHTWSMFTGPRAFEDPNQIEQNLMFLSTWDCDSDIEYNWSIFIDARVSEDP